MKILFITPILEYPSAGGPQLRIENSIKALSSTSELDIVHIASGPMDVTDKTSNFFRKYGVEYHVLSRIVAGDIFSRTLSLIEKILNRLFDTRIAKHAEFLLNHVDRRQIDVLWFGFGNISYPLIKYVKEKRPELKVVCDTDSVWSRFVLRELPYTKGIRRELE